MIDIFKALSEESRLRILSLLIHGEMCVCEIESCLNMTQSNASRHLNVLKRSNILNSHKKGLWTYFHINDEFTNENTELWNYLKPRLKELKTYSTDYNQYKECVSKDICRLGKQPH